MLEQARELRGPAASPMRAQVLGRLGIALSKTGDRTEAIRVTREALELCKLAEDRAGIEAYQTNLNALATYEIAKGDEAGNHVTVVFTDSEGNVLTPHELSTASGTIRWEVRYSGERTSEADRLHKEGRAAGSKGDNDLAIALLTRAAELDPTWPYPIYDRAYAHL